MGDALWLALPVIAAVLAASVVYGYRRRGSRRSPAAQAGYEALRAANVAVTAFGGGLTPEGARRAGPHVRSLLGTRGLVIAGPGTILAVAGIDVAHVAELEPIVTQAFAGGRLEGGRLEVLASGWCGHRWGRCPFGEGVVAPLIVNGTVVGALVGLDSSESLDISESSDRWRRAGETARFVSTQLELAEALARTLEAGPGADPFDVVAVESVGRVVVLSRSEVEWAESCGDYIRLHTATGESHLLRLPLGVLEQHWTAHGFARVHRSYLVALRSVRELHTVGSQSFVRVGSRDLPVSRRHLHDLRERLVRPGPARTTR